MDFSQGDYLPPAPVRREDRNHILRIGIRAIPYERVPVLLRLWPRTDVRICIHAHLPTAVFGGYAHADQPERVSTRPIGDTTDRSPHPRRHGQRGRNHAYG